MKRRKSRKPLGSSSQRLAKEANLLKNPLTDLSLTNTFIGKNNSNIEIKCIKATDADSQCLKQIFDLMEENMKSMYEKSSWGWDFQSKQTELTESKALYLIATIGNNEFLGFSHFRFEMDYGIPILYCYELQLKVTARGIGIGRFMLSTLESMAGKTKMSKVVLTVFKHNPKAIDFFNALGYRLDNTNPSVSENADYIILSKNILL